MIETPKTFCSFVQILLAQPHPGAPAHKSYRYVIGHFSLITKTISPA